MPLGGVVGLILLLELILSLGGFIISSQSQSSIAAPRPNVNDVTNTEAIGNLIYTNYIYFFQAAGLILLVAMIGAIVLTHRSRENVRKQNISDQINRRPQDTIEIKKVTTGSGA